jgi:hypothetical protein
MNLETRRRHGDRRLDLEEATLVEERAQPPIELRSCPQKREARREPNSLADA